MQYSFSFAFAALAALASTAVAQTTGFVSAFSPTPDQILTAGQSFDIQWSVGTPSSPITINLVGGASSSSLSFVSVVAVGVEQSQQKYTFIVPTTAPFKNYGFNFTLDADPNNIFQYSNAFHIVGASSSSSSSSVASATPVTSTVKSSSAVSTVTAKTISAANSTSTSVSTKTSTSDSSVARITGNSTSSASAVVVTSTAAANNVTSLLTTLTPSASKTSGTPTSSSSTVPIPTKNAAVTQAATGSLAIIGGIILAFAL